MSILEGSFFARSNLSLQQIIHVLYYYAYQQASCKILKRECGIQLEDSINWRHYVQDVFSHYLTLHPVKIGGCDHVVGVGKFSVRNRLPVGEGKMIQSVFVGIDSETQESFLVAVDQGDAETLLSVLQDFVLPGTIVVSILWNTYGTHNHVDYECLEMKHDLKFEDVATQDTSLLNLWLRAKQWLNKEDGLSPTVLPSYLHEFMWRDRFRHDPFKMLLEHIRLAYPV